MPLLENRRPTSPSPGAGLAAQVRRQSERYSVVARAAIMSSVNNTPQSEYDGPVLEIRSLHHASLVPPPKPAFGKSSTGHMPNKTIINFPNALGASLTDTPAPTAPGSPQM